MSYLQVMKLRPEIKNLAQYYTPAKTWEHDIIKENLQSDPIPIFVIPFVHCHIKISIPLLSIVRAEMNELAVRVVENDLMSIFLRA
jgi:hypothetical protein